MIFYYLGNYIYYQKQKKEYLNYLKTSFKNLPKELFSDKKEENHD